MSRLETFKQQALNFDRWLNTPSSLSPKASQLRSLRWWTKPTILEKYCFRLMLLATFASAFYLFGCNSATPPQDNPYIGTWEHARLPGYIVTINQFDGQVLIHTPQSGGTDYLAVFRNGLLQLTDGSGQFYEYHKDTDTITSSGNKEFVLRRKK